MTNVTRPKIIHLVVVGLFATVSVAAAVTNAGAGKGNSVVIGDGPDIVYIAGALSSASVTVSAGKVGQNTQITLDVSGVDAPAGTTFGAHVHVLPCATSGGAGVHYANDGAGSPLKNQEVWLDFTVNANGTGHAVATRHFEIGDRPNRSVVIHAMPTDHETGLAGARLACTELDG